MATLVYQSPYALRLSVKCAIPHVMLFSIGLEEAERNYAGVLQSCPDAIEEVFDSKLHIIGGAGITIGVVMVSVGFTVTHQV